MSVQELTAAKLGAVLITWLAEQKERLRLQVESGATTVDESFWIEEQQKIVDSMRPILKDAYLVGFTAALREIYFGEKALISIEFGAQADEFAAEWVLANADALASQLTQTTRKAVAKVLAEFFRTPGMTWGDMADLLENTYGIERADAIAVTETTRAFAEASLEAGRAANAQGANLVPIWRTLRDDRVCKICGPRHNKRRGDGWVVGPPAHVWCRCSIQHISPRGAELF